MIMESDRWGICVWRKRTADMTKHHCRNLGQCPKMSLHICKRERIIIPGRRAHRWVVERTHSWINRSRRLLVRWENKAENYLAFLQLACAQLIFAKM
jgi:transposase